MPNDSPRTHHLESYLDFTARKDVYQPLLEFMRQQMDGNAPPRVLEIGCAAGVFLGYLAGNHVPVQRAIGIDPDIEALKYAMPKSVVCGSALRLPFPDDCFDFVFMVSVLHHLNGQNFDGCRQKWIKAFQEGIRVCCPGGYVLIREGLAVRRRVLQQVIFHITRLLCTKHIEIRPLHIEGGEVLAFLTPSDMLHLCQGAPGTSVARCTSDARDGSEFPGILNKVWKLQTCSLTAILQKSR